MNRDIGPQVVSYGEPQPARRSTFRRLFPLIVQLWMTAVLLTFITIRVLGSNAVHNVFLQRSSR